MKNSKQEQALAALLEHTTVRSAAHASGIPERTIWRYLENDEFSKKLEYEKGILISSASDRLKAKLEAATNAIAAVMEDPEAPAQTRVSAGRTILEFTLRYAEIADVIHRIEQLERRDYADNGIQE